MSSKQSCIMSVSPDMQPIILRISQRSARQVFHDLYKDSQIPQSQSLLSVCIPILNLGIKGYEPCLHELHFLLTRCTRSAFLYTYSKLESRSRLSMLHCPEGQNASLLVRPTRVAATVLWLFQHPCGGHPP